MALWSLDVGITCVKLFKNRQILRPDDQQSSQGRHGSDSGVAGVCSSKTGSGVVGADFGAR